MVYDSGMRRPLAICLISLFLANGVIGAAEPTDTGNGSDEQLLQEVGLGRDGPALLDFFRSRTQVAAHPETVQQWIEQLAIGPEPLRRIACGRLVALGPPAVPLLRQAVKDPDDRERMERARRCLEAIGKSEVPAAAARLVAEQRLPEAVPVLLAYLPFADDDTVLTEVQSTLARLALRENQPDAALLAALADPLPLRRASAAVALCRGGGPPQIPAVRKLLDDPRPTVRLRVALALADLHEEAAVPVLIALLDLVPVDQGKRIIEQLETVAGGQAPGVPPGNTPAERHKCRDAWAEWWRSADSPALLGFFRQRTLSDTARDRVQVLIRQLGDDSFDVREKASANLVALGPPIVPLLHRAESSSDQEVASRARDCLKLLDRPAAGLTPVSAARLLALRKPAGAAATLLAYLPFAEDASAADAAQQALAAVTLRDGKVDAAVTSALTDASASRRAAAVTALCRSGASDLTPARALLQDREPQVRLQAAVGLAGRHERAAIPVLIDLLDQAAPTQSWQAEEILERLAGDQAPLVAAGTAPARRKYRDAWASWWQKNAHQVDLARLDGPERLLGYTLLIQADRRNNWQVVEKSADGKIRWQITGLNYPTDAQILPGNRVLIAEHHGQQVTERDFKNTILWKRQVVMPVNCQRLANGHTVIASRNQLVEVDRQNKEVFTYRRPQHDLMAGARLRDGQFVYVTASGFCFRLDAAGHEVKNFPVGPCQPGGIDVLPSGRILVAQHLHNLVAEYDPDGKMVWQATVNSPSAAVRLANGHTLVACSSSQALVELDRSGKVLGEQKLETRPWRARRR
jgi:HEAT repeat protein